MRIMPEIIEFLGRTEEVVLERTLLNLPRTVKISARASILGEVICSLALAVQV